MALYHVESSKNVGDLWRQRDKNDAGEHEGGRVQQLIDFGHFAIKEGGYIFVILWMGFFFCLFFWIG